MPEINPAMDEELVRRLREGDEAAFVLLYDRWQRPIYRFALQMSGRPSLAEETVQETFLALIRTPELYDGSKGAVSVYLFGIARNVMWGALKRERNFLSIEPDEAVFSDQGKYLSNIHRMEQAEEVRRAVLALPGEFREIVILCDLQELTYEQAASICGCAVGTVRSRLHRARQRLVRVLREDFGASSKVKGKVARCLV